MIYYRIAKDQQGKTHLWQIVNGMVGELAPNAADRKLQPGIYDKNFQLLVPEPTPGQKTKR